MYKEAAKRNGILENK